MIRIIRIYSTKIFYILVSKEKTTKALQLTFLLPYDPDKTTH